MRRFAAPLAAVAVLVVACGGPASPAAPRGTAATGGPSAHGAGPGVTQAPTSASTSTGAPPHVMVIVMENREASAVAGAPSWPYVTSLLTRYGSATSMYAMTHPSLPNYLELIAGSTFGIDSDCTRCRASGTTLADQLDGAGVGWTAYMEGMPSPCWLGESNDGYALKHDPFLYFPQLRSGPACARIVPGERLASDLAAGRVPPFVFVGPTLCHDGHDCSDPVADHWLQQTMTAVLASPWYAQQGTVVVTWDEGSTSAGCCGTAAGGHIATAVVAERLAGGRRLTTPVDQAGLLRAIEEAYGLPLLGDASCACSGDLLPLLHD